jgi:hypothetical protein
MLSGNIDRSRPSRTMRVSSAVATGAFAIVTAAAAAAQGPATLTGIVTDPMNRGIPAAAVVVRSVESGNRHDALTDEGGRFTLPALPTGTYLVEVQVPGFRKSGQRLQVSAPRTRSDVRLALGDLSESVSVIGGPDDGAASTMPRSQSIAMNPVPSCTPSATGGNIVAPRRIRNVNPVYPARLVPERVSGTVVLTGTIGTDGRMKQVTVLGTPHPDLAAAARDAVEQWEYTQTLLNCAAVDVAT